MKKFIAVIKLSLLFAALSLAITSALPQSADANPFPWCTGGPFVCEIDQHGNYYYQEPDGY